MNNGACHFTYLPCATVLRVRCMHRSCQHVFIAGRVGEGWGGLGRSFIITGAVTGETIGTAHYGIPFLINSLFSPWDGRSPVSHPTCDVPFPARRTGRYRKGMISAHPSYQGVMRSVWDPETFAPGHKSRAEARPTGRAASRERQGDWDGPMAV